VQWHEFTSGLPLLEALNIGALDLSADVADAVPPFALAAGAKLTYYAIETPSPQAQAIVVRKDSPITSLAQLKGQKVAFAKGAGAHFLLLEALADAGLSIKDIEPAYLTPGRWPRRLRERQRRGLGDLGPVPGRRAAAVRRARAAGRRQAVELPPLLPGRHAVCAAARGRAQAVGLRRAAAAGAWIKANPAAAAEWHAPGDRAGCATVEAANQRRSYRVQPVDAEALAEQQRIADAFQQAASCRAR
jgi:sulfonate transport system substrate-binding protein